MGLSSEDIIINWLATFPVPSDPLATSLFIILAAICCPQPTLALHRLESPELASFLHPTVVLTGMLAGDYVASSQFAQRVEFIDYRISTKGKSHSGVAT